MRFLHGTRWRRLRVPGKYRIPAIRTPRRSSLCEPLGGSLLKTVSTAPCAVDTVVQRPSAEGHAKEEEVRIAGIGTFISPIPPIPRRTGRPSRTGESVAMPDLEISRRSWRRNGCGVFLSHGAWQNLVDLRPVPVVRTLPWPPRNRSHALEMPEILGLDEERVELVEPISRIRSLHFVLVETHGHAAGQGMRCPSASMTTTSE